MSPRHSALPLKTAYILFKKKKKLLVKNNEPNYLNSVAVYELLLGRPCRARKYLSPMRDAPEPGGVSATTQNVALSSSKNLACIFWILSERIYRTGTVRVCRLPVLSNRTIRANQASTKGCSVASSFTLNIQHSHVLDYDIRHCCKMRIIRPGCCRLDLLLLKWEIQPRCIIQVDLSGDIQTSGNQAIPISQNSQAHWNQTGGRKSEKHAKRTLRISSHVRVQVWELTRTVGRQRNTCR